MPQYLITDIRTNVGTWVDGASVREALIAHENGWRSVKLPGSTRISDYGDSRAIDATLGESVCRGFLENVVRAEATTGM